MAGYNQQIKACSKQKGKGQSRLLVKIMGRKKSNSALIDSLAAVDANASALLVFPSTIVAPHIVRIPFPRLLHLPLHLVAALLAKNAIRVIVFRTAKLALDFHHVTSLVYNLAQVIHPYKY
jgi:hypothetical protein